LFQIYLVFGDHVSECATRSWSKAILLKRCCLLNREKNLHMCVCWSW